MRKKFDVVAYMDTCKDGEEILAFCKEHQIQNFAVLVDSSDKFPEDKRDIWFKHLCSAGFVKFLATRGIK